jgi:hypothetical protein
MNVEPDAVEDFEGREVDLFALALPHARVVRARHVGLMSGDH